MGGLLVCFLLGWAEVRLGWSQATSVLDGIAAIVNDDIITISEVREAMGPEAGQLQLQYTGNVLRQRTAALYQRALQGLIDVRLQLAQARKLHLKVDDDDVSYHIETLKKQNQISDEQFTQALEARGLTVEAYRRQVHDGLLVAKIVNVEVRSRLVVLDTELQAVYEERRERYKVPGELTVSHILFLLPPNASQRDEEQARQKGAKVLQELRNGGDFAALARQYSDGPSAQQGGILGTFRSGELLPGFEEVAATLKPGEISDLVRTRAGLHIIRVEDRKDGGYKPIEAVQEEIKTELLQAKTERKYAEWLETLRQNAYVKILYDQG
jgi:peptidyl-prolyl cis-trans isomerase SurA